jgi:MFS family permease
MSSTEYLGEAHRTNVLKKAWLVCFIGSLFFLYEFIQLSSFDALNQFLTAHFSLSASQLSLLGSAFLWGNVIFLLPAGFLLDKFGPRKVILISLAIAVLGVGIFAFSHSFILAFTSRLMTGVGNAFCFVSLVVLVSRWFPASKQAFAMGTLVNMAFIGGMFSHTPLVWLLSHFSWQKLMLANMLLGILVWGLIFLFLADYPANRASEFSNKHTTNIGFWQSFRKVLIAQNVFAGLYTACLNLPIMVLCALWGMQYLQVVHHLSIYQASNVVSMIFLGSMIGCPLAGWLSDQMQLRKPVMWFGVIAALVLSMPLFFADLSLSQTALAFIFFGLGCVTSTQVLSYPMIAESNSFEYAGRACSIASMIIMGGGMLAQMLFGYLLDWHHGSSKLPGVSDFHFAMKLFPCSILLALLSMFILRETFCKNQ